MSFEELGHEFLTDTIKVSLSIFKNKNAPSVFYSVRKMYLKDGKMLPSYHGLSFSLLTAGDLVSAAANIFYTTSRGTFETPWKYYENHQLYLFNPDVSSICICKPKEDFSSFLKLSIDERKKLLDILHTLLRNANHEYAPGWISKFYERSGE